MLTLNDGRNELWQWDTGRTLTVDAECSQVHFSNKVFGRSIDVDVVDGVASIPDILLQTDKELTAWAFVGTPENGYTKISKVFKVNRRNKPSDYVFTPPEQTTLSELVERLDAIEEIGAVSYKAQTLTDEQKAQARENIGVPSGGNVDLDTTLTQSGKAADAKAVGDAVIQLSGEIAAKHATVEIRDSDPEVSEMYNGRMWIMLGASEEEPDETTYPPFFVIGNSISFNAGSLSYDWGYRISVATLNSDGVAPAILAGTTYVSETAYPIPVPADATTISVVCDGYVWGVAGFAYADGTYTYDLDPGWKPSGETVSFEAGSVDYVVFNLKKPDGSEIPRETDTSGISIVIE